METKLDRRTVLKTVGGAGLAAAFGSRALALLGEDALAADAASTCLLTPEATEGPYWVEDAMTRRNVTEGQGGHTARDPLHRAERPNVQDHQER